MRHRSAGRAAEPVCIRVRREHAERVLLDPILDELLAPERAQRMAREIERQYRERIVQRQARSAEQPKELQELNARIDRLRARLKAGDPDMTPDELQLAIERAEAKRRELEQHQPAAKETAKILSILPKAATFYRAQIRKGLNGDTRAALKARMILRELFGGEIRLAPEPDGGLTAHWNLQTAVLLRAVGSGGSGGPLFHFPRAAGPTLDSPASAQQAPAPCRPPR